MLRNPKETDIPAILEYLNLSSGETDFLIRYPEEITFTYEILYIHVRNSPELVDNRLRFEYNRLWIFAGSLSI